jgi:arylsulfatase A-like enzyme
VVAGADGCVGQVAESVDSLRRRGDDVLLLVGSDHGHETVDAVIPVTDLLVAAGLKAHADSSDVVLASSGMGALVYFAEDTLGRRESVAHWLRAQPWCGPVYTGASLAEIGHRSDTALGIAFGMAKRDEPNRHGVMGLGHVAADQFMRSDAPGRGQHGGLGPYESNPFLLASGPAFHAGVHERPTSTVDIAPTILEHLGIAAPDLDGTPLPRL